MATTLKQPRLVFLERLLLTIWIGGMWTVGYLVAPVLFGVLDDRRLAGELAGHLFKAINIIGLGSGLILVAGLIALENRLCLKNWRFWTLTGMLLIVCIGLFVLQPMMAEIKLQGTLIEGSELSRRFGLLHGISSALYLVTSISGLVLVMFGVYGNKTDQQKVDIA